MLVINIGIIAALAPTAANDQFSAFLENPASNLVLFFLALAPYVVLIVMNARTPLWYCSIGATIFIWAVFSYAVFTSNGDFNFGAAFLVFVSPAIVLMAAG